MTRVAYWKLDSFHIVIMDGITDYQIGWHDDAA